ncbi:hypothetical protein [Streptomyces sp. I8-5]|uniref:hypothetical protein n=1 Tax=Streptomyces sp. I8-5 TaxID=3104277 RepID=UPI00386C9DC7
MAALATQNIVAAGTAPTFGAASASDTAEVGNGYNTFAVYRNSGAASVTVTVAAPGNTSYGEPNPDPDFTLGDGSSNPTEAWVPLRKEYDAGDGSGRATITVSPATNVTVAIVRVG